MHQYEVATRVANLATESDSSHRVGTIAAPSTRKISLLTLWHKAARVSRETNKMHAEWIG